MIGEVLELQEGLSVKLEAQPKIGGQTHLTLSAAAEEPRRRISRASSAIVFQGPWQGTHYHNDLQRLQSSNLSSLTGPKHTAHMMWPLEGPIYRALTGSDAVGAEVEKG